jgi:glycosyltransferase involved in cell wall biosynthesis
VTRPSSRHREGLLVVIPHGLSEILTKGEVVERYYNPGGVFNRVDIVMTVDDHPDPALVQTMVGDAELHLHSVPIPDGLFRRTLGFRPRLLGRWTEQIVALARQARPSLVRCHGAHLNALAARHVREQLGVPYAVSLHINPDEDIRNRALTRGDRLRLRAMQPLERAGLLGADVVLPVYEPIVPYLRRLGVTRYEVAYNVVGGRHLRLKEDYALHDPVRVISVGRLFDAKNPEHLIRAVDEIGGIELTVVGDGPLRPGLERLGSDRVTFLPSVPNADLCARLAEQDIFATHTEYWEISKAILEPLLTGLPVLLNRRVGTPVPELANGICHFVENSVEGYRGGLRELIGDDDARENLGRRGRREAAAQWAPEQTEARFAEIYRNLLGAAPQVPSAA